MRIDEAAIGRGISTTVWPGRFQRLDKGPLAAMAAARGSDLWLDGAHNPHAGRALAETVGRLAARDGRPVALIVGMLGRKDATGFFPPFAPLKPNVFTTAFESPNATPPEALAQAAAGAGLKVAVANGVVDALARALAEPGPAPHVIIGGSLHFVGDVLAMSPETWPS